jgi:hypothetical protein
MRQLCLLFWVEWPWKLPWSSQRVLVSQTITCGLLRFKRRSFLFWAGRNLVPDLHTKLKSRGIEMAASVGRRALGSGSLALQQSS